MSEHLDIDTAPHLLRIRKLLVRAVTIARPNLRAKDQVQRCNNL